MKKIGVEKGLSMIGDYLSSEGYSVQTLSGNFQDNVSKCEDLDAIVTAGYNTDMMGFSDTSTKVPVINADGLTEEEVKNIIQRKITRS